MDKRSAISLIQDTLENPFDKRKFAYLVSNMLDHIEAAPFIYRGNIIPHAYKTYISTLERIGKYKDREGNKIDLLIVRLEKETSLERARTMQRNFIAWYLNGSRGDILKDAALVAFVSPDTEDWRFSLVKMDYRLDTSGEKVKVKKELTPARRWSFLVGTNEKSHTAQSRLVKMLANDEQDPTLKEIEKAFDIETVTKEFFLKYRELFLHTKEELDRVVEKDPKIKADFDAKGVDTVNFAKKLLGQIIFLYFLQKKGWFGVGRDDDWGTGSKHFLRELFEKKHGDYNNFFNDILEPLFYDALRNDRSHDDGYYSRFDCKIPFLNGGLFDPIGNYDWVHIDILLPNELFSNQTKTKEGDIGTGILDVFDRYNFTVKEDEPLEKEVAIDPELLGKSYEKFNAIRPDNYAEFKKALKSGRKGEENKFNKKFGVYYTPREIVHYMCQQSLINYLHTEVIASEAKQSLTPSKEDIETLIHTGEQLSENEAIFLEKEQKIKNGEQKTTSIKSILPESIRKNAKLLDDKLAEITVCDPAVGSGAFPVGMMSEIVKIRNVLTPFLSLRGAQATCLRAGTHRQAKQSQFDDNRTVYNFKRRCIEHSLYGVDIDPGAVEIAKLRLWLSLVVDEDDIKNIKPLPNLDYRIMQGNSLISEFMGINFDDDENTNLKKEIEALNAEEKPLKKEKADKESKSSRHYKKTKNIDQNLLNEINVLDDKISKLKKKRTQLNKKLNHQEESPEIINLISEFQKKKNNFLNESNVSQKSKLKEEIDDLLVKIFETKLRTQKADYFNRLKNIENKYSVVRNEKQRDELIKQDKEKLYKESDFDLELVEKQLKEFTSGRQIKPFFLWNLYFSEVFHNKGGFDVVIGNPPYFNLSTVDKKIVGYLKETYRKIHTGYNDIVYYFIYLSFKLLSLNGISALITSNYYLGNEYAQKLRVELVPYVFKVINFKDHQVFSEASVHTCITFLHSCPDSDTVLFYESNTDQANSGVMLEEVLQCVPLQRDQLKEEWVIADTDAKALIEKLHAKALLLGNIAEIAKGSETGKNSVFTVTDEIIKNAKIERSIIRSCVKNSNIHRYYIEMTGKRLIYTDNNFDKKLFPCTFTYLESFKDMLLQRRGPLHNEYEWWRLHRPSLKHIFDAPEKILVPYRAHRNTFAYDDEQCFNDGGDIRAIVITDKRFSYKYVLALLNSTLLDWFYGFIGKPKGDAREYFNKPLALIPIKQPSSVKEISEIETRVEKILALKKGNPAVDVSALETEIDQLVYKLYNFTPEEIKIVEGY